MQTLRQQAVLRTLTRKRFKRLTPAGAFWLPYLFVALLLIAYAVVS